MAFENEEEEEEDMLSEEQQEEEEEEVEEREEREERVWASERVRASQEVADMNAFRPMTSGLYSGDVRKSWDNRGVAEKKGTNNDEV